MLLYFNYIPIVNIFCEQIYSILFYIIQLLSVVVLLHNDKWLKKISTKFSSSFETVQSILSSMLCPSIFRQIAAILMARRFSAR